MALASATVEALWLMTTRVDRGDSDNICNLKLASSTLRALIDDWTQLKTAMDAISALEGPGDDLTDAQTLSDAAVALSEATVV